MSIFALINEWIDHQYFQSWSDNTRSRIND